MSKTVPVRPPAIPPANSPGNAPFAPGGSLGGGGSVVIPVLGAQLPNLIVPPGGFVAFGAQSQATQALFQRYGRMGGRTSAARRRRRKAKTARATPKRRSRSTSRRARTSRRRAARLVKGSAAAKRYMARIRKLRRRRR